jgi:hypothetical protein
MTRSKLDLATILVKLRGDGSDPEVLAKDLTLMKLCHEIQKLEEERELAAEAEAETPEAPAEAAEAEPAEPLTKKEKQMIEEMKAPEEATKTEKKRHILSWLLDSSDED